MQRVQKQNEDADRNMKAAFGDLTSLMDNAREMVQLAEKFSASLQKQASKDKEDADELSNFQAQLGIASPVTKANAGSQYASSFHTLHCHIVSCLLTARYHNQLSRQLADWLALPGGPLSQVAGGMIPLTDLYCMFNRARQTTAMVSPEDLYRACLLFDELGLPVRLRSFPSGVSIVQLSSATDAQIGQVCPVHLTTRTW
jgi:ESCRT-II complex subunit VPS36